MWEDFQKIKKLPLVNNEPQIYITWFKHYNICCELIYDSAVWFKIR